MISFLPHVLNRIGNNVIVFDFIREDVAKSIVRGQVKKINERIKKQNKLFIEVSDNGYNYFNALAQRPGVLEMGGRGIGNMMEEHYINPLAEFIFTANCQEGNSILVDCVKDEIKFERKEY